MLLQNKYIVYERNLGILFLTITGFLSQRVSSSSDLIILTIIQLTNISRNAKNRYGFIVYYLNFFSPLNLNNFAPLFFDRSDFSISRGNNFAMKNRHYIMFSKGFACRRFSSINQTGQKMKSN